MYLREKLKQILGLGFAAGEQGVIEAVITNNKALKEIKASLGLPLEATPKQVKQRIKVLKAEHEELISLKGEWESRKKG